MAHGCPQAFGPPGPSPGHGQRPVTGAEPGLSPWCWGTPALCPPWASPLHLQTEEETGESGSGEVRKSEDPFSPISPPKAPPRSRVKAEGLPPRSHEGVPTHPPTLERPWGVAVIGGLLPLGHRLPGERCGSPHRDRNPCRHARGARWCSGARVPPRPSLHGTPGGQEMNLGLRGGGCCGLSERGGSVHLGQAPRGTDSRHGEILAWGKSRWKNREPFGRSARTLPPKQQFQWSEPGRETRQSQAAQSAGPGSRPYRFEFQLHHFWVGERLDPLMPQFTHL